MLPIAAADRSLSISQASTVFGGHDYTGMIVDSVLRNVESESITLQNASTAIATEFVHWIQPTVSSVISVTRHDDRDKAKVIIIDNLVTFKLATPLSAIIEPDADAFLVRCHDLPVFGFADDPIDAIASLKREIESLYQDLMEDDNLSPQMLSYKEFLRDKVIG
jgi:hypothetical protein